MGIRFLRLFLLTTLSLQLTWKDIKSRVRTKIAGLRMERNRTGNIPTESPSLTDLEQEILDIGIISAEGSDAPDSMPESVASIRDLMNGNNGVLENVPGNASIGNMLTNTNEGSLMPAASQIELYEVPIEEYEEIVVDDFIMPSPVEETFIPDQEPEDVVPTTTSHGVLNRPSPVTQCTTSESSAQAPAHSSSGRTPKRKGGKAREDIATKFLGIQEKQTEALSILTIEKQVFDFLGYMWIPILANFFNIIFVIFGCFGVFQQQQNYVVTYIVWCILWICWNSFLICFYLNVGVLNKDSYVLNLGTGSVSWWEANGAGCQPSYSVNDTIDDPFKFPRPEKVAGCILDYEFVETIHSSVQCIFGVIGVISGMTWNCALAKEVKSQSEFGGRRSDSIKRTSLYSIEFSSNDIDDNLAYEGETQVPGPPSSPRPMTPRRVKRRSVISRGSTSRSSQQDRHNIHTLRNSHRSSQRRTRAHHQNPVTRILEQQQSHAFVDSSTSNESTRLHFSPSTASHWRKAIGHTNPLYQQDSIQSLNTEDICNTRPSSARSSYSNYHGARPVNSVASNGVMPPYFINRATPQVPVTQCINPRTAAMAFFKNGPPPYHVEGMVDSETVI